MDGDLVVGERHRRGGHVEPPHPRPLGADERHHLVPCALQVGDPRPQRPVVVLAQRLDVADLEAGALHRQHALADVDQLTVREDVAPDERRLPELRSADLADGVVQQPTRRPQGTAQQPVVAVEVLVTDVLGHPDRRDRVVLLAADVAVVLQSDLDPIGDAGSRHPLASPGGLGLTDRDADRRHVVVAGGVDHHRAPPAPDVEEAPARHRVEPELATDEIVLQRLRGDEIGRVVDEAGTRVRHRRSEHEPVEVVADVVVVVDRGGVASLPSGGRRAAWPRAAAVGAADRARRGDGRP